MVTVPVVTFTAPPALTVPVDENARVAAATVIVLATVPAPVTVRLIPFMFRIPAVPVNVPSNVQFVVASRMLSPAPMLNVKFRTFPVPEFWKVLASWLP